MNTCYKISSADGFQLFLSFFFNILKIFFFCFYISLIKMTFCVGYFGVSIYLNVKCVIIINQQNYGVFRFLTFENRGVQ